MIKKILLVGFVVGVAFLPVVYCAGDSHCDTGKQPAEASNNEPRPAANSNDTNALLVGLCAVLVALAVGGAQYFIASNTLKHTQYVNGIGYLGHDKRTVILGGIYALHNLAKTAPHKYSQTVFDILCGFVREKTNKDVYKQYVNSILNSHYTNTEPNNDVISLNVIQTIINRLFLLSDSEIYRKKRWRVPANRANLRYADLRGITFENKLCMQVACLWRADFRDAGLKDADLQGADFYCADFRGTDLRGADLSGADVEYIMFSEETLFDHGTKFCGVQSSPNVPEGKFNKALQDGVKKGFKTTLHKIKIYNSKDCQKDCPSAKRTKQQIEEWLKNKMYEGTIMEVLEEKGMLGSTEELRQYVAGILTKAPLIFDSSQSGQNSSLVMAINQVLSSSQLVELDEPEQNNLKNNIKKIPHNFDDIEHKDLKKLAKELRIPYQKIGLCSFFRRS